MSNAPSPSELPRNVIEELQLQLARVSAPMSAERFWERVLTEDDRQRLGGNLQAAYRERHGTVGMWMWLRAVAQPQAVVDVARALGFLDDATYRWLLREIGEPQQESPNREVPVWNRTEGRLRWRNRIVRRVRIMRQPSNIQRILDAFETAGWPASLDNPLPGRVDQLQLHQALKSLNHGLIRIRFRAQRGAAEIIWERA